MNQLSIPQSGTIEEIYSDSPDGSRKWWGAHLSVLFLGAVGAADVCLAHGLARESDILLRQAYETTVLLRYLIRHPEVAMREIAAFPIHAVNAWRTGGRPAEEVAMLEAALTSHLKEHPELAGYKTRELATTSAMLDEDDVMRAVRFDYYKLPSQTGHGTILSFVSVSTLREDGQVAIDPGADAGTENQVLFYLTLLTQRFMIDVAKAFGKTAPNIRIGKSVAEERAKELNLYFPVPVGAFVG